jgi:hypothetical protein
MKSGFLRFILVIAWLAIAYCECAAKELANRAYMQSGDSAQDWANPGKQHSGNQRY